MKNESGLRKRAEEFLKNNPEAIKKVPPEDILKLIEELHIHQIESEKRLREVIENMPVMMNAFDQEGSIIVWNRECERVSGFSADEIIGSPGAMELLYPDQAYRQRVTAESLERDNDYYGREQEVACKDGSTKSVAWSSISKRFPVSDWAAWRVGVDITKHKHAEQERVRLATVVEQAAESVIISDRPGTIQYVNPAFERLSGFMREDIVGKNFRILKSDHHDEAFYRHMWEVISHGKIWAGRIYNRMKDGTIRVFETIISPIRDSSGEIVNFVSVNRDVTQEIELEAQLRQAQRTETIGTLAGGIAHDFNNILSAVIGYTELALMHIEQGSIIHSYLQGVLSAGERARELINHILIFSRQAERELKPIQVKLLAKEALKLLRATLPATIEIRQDLKSESVVLGNSTQIHQIVMNLGTNAGHAMQKKGGILEVRLTNEDLDASFPAKSYDLKPGKYLKLTVSDTGHGMTPDILEKIFDPFFTTKEKGEGTGMGLSVVHGIVKSHGGTILANSEPGKGSVFNVYLPAIEITPETQIEMEEPLPTGTERILFVDDEEAIVNIGKQVLETLGYDITTITSSIEALELFRAQPDRFDLIITDLTMPKLTGEDLAKELMRIRPDVPVMLCTGFSAMIDEKKAMEMGIRAFIYKPILKRKIARTIRAVLDN